MKQKKLKSLCLAVGCLAAMVATNISYADVKCNGRHCDFSKLTPIENQNPFYCEVTDEKTPSKVTFQNNHVLITGFKKGEGSLVLEGDDVNKLGQFYFDAKLDPDYPAGPYTVDVASVEGGNVVCKEGKGGRGTKWPGAYGK